MKRDGQDQPARYGAMIRVRGNDSDELMTFMERVAVAVIEGKSKSKPDQTKGNIDDR